MFHLLSPKITPPLEALSKNVGKEMVSVLMFASHHIGSLSMRGGLFPGEKFDGPRTVKQEFLIKIKRRVNGFRLTDRCCGSFARTQLQDRQRAA
jgi:hypothetical protein